MAYSWNCLFDYSDNDVHLNLKALRRADPYAKEVVESSLHVTLYKYEKNEWKDTDIGGPLFLYSRYGEPSHILLIMDPLDRFNPISLIMPLTHRLQLELEEPHLIYRNCICRSYRLTFYYEGEFVRVATTLNLLVKNLMEQPTPRDLYGCLVYNGKCIYKGQDCPSTEYDTTVTFTIKQRSQDDQNEAIVTNESTELSAMEAPDKTSPSVIDFFKQAGKCSPEGSGRAQDVLLLEKLNSDPLEPAHSLECIENEQRYATEQLFEIFNSYLTRDSKMQQNNGSPVESTPIDEHNQSDSQHGLSSAEQCHPESVDTTETDMPLNLETDLGLMSVSSPKSDSPLP